MIGLLAPAMQVDLLKAGHVLSQYNFKIICVK